jgi:hypothetical protein
MSKGLNYPTQMKSPLQYSIIHNFAFDHTPSGSVLLWVFENLVAVPFGQKNENVPRIRSMQSEDDMRMPAVLKTDDGPQECLGYRYSIMTDRGENVLLHYNEHKNKKDTTHPTYIHNF